MRLVEAIVDANHRALAGDEKAGLRLAEHADALPVVALTCSDARLNPLLPEVVGIPEEQFLWVRNAGNVVSHPLGSTARSVALACLLEGAREILVIGHTDCRVARQTISALLERLAALGIARESLPENLQECFALFGSEPQNVHTACEMLRNSPLISPRIPVHGLMVDLQTGRLDWLVNGYNTLPAVGEVALATLQTARQTVTDMREGMDYRVGSRAFSDLPVGQLVAEGADWLGARLNTIEELWQAMQETTRSETAVGLSAGPSTHKEVSEAASQSSRVIPVPPPLTFSKSRKPEP
ncbi:MAG: carbonic anhydrase [Verrucomicrobiota bacterium]|nr:hypothetical protein [Limisphaera sp.]MDW8381513.1 carbonic anhydrase [Verrucomicrobiota bacterium]